MIVTLNPFSQKLTDEMVSDHFSEVQRRDFWYGTGSTGSILSVTVLYSWGLSMSAQSAGPLNGDRY